MKKASTLKVSAQLCKLTKLNPLKENDTGWRSIYEMIEQFLRILAEWSAVSDLLPMLPTHVECDILHKGFAHLEQFHQVTLMVQTEGITKFEIYLTQWWKTTLSSVDNFPWIRRLLLTKCLSEQCWSFQRIWRSRMWDGEVYVACCCPLWMTLQTMMLLILHYLVQQRQEMFSSWNWRTHNSLKLGMKRKGTGNGNDNTWKYMNLGVLVGTSVSCERLFSAAKFILTDLRKSMSLTMFEAILLLKANCCEWDVYAVARALGRTAGNMSA